MRKIEKGMGSKMGWHDGKADASFVNDILPLMSFPNVLQDSQEFRRGFVQCTTGFVIVRL